MCFSGVMRFWGTTICHFWPCSCMSMCSSEDSLHTHSDANLAASCMYLAAFERRVDRCRDRASDLTWHCFKIADYGVCCCERCGVGGARSPRRGLEGVSSSDDAKTKREGRHCHACHHRGTHLVASVLAAHARAEISRAASRPPPGEAARCTQCSAPCSLRRTVTANPSVSSRARAAPWTSRASSLAISAAAATSTMSTAGSTTANSAVIDPRSSCSACPFTVSRLCRVRFGRDRPALRALRLSA